MKIRFLALVLLLLFCLSSCGSDELYVSNQNANIASIFVSAEIKTRRRKKDETFEIQVGLGRMLIQGEMYDFPNVELRIYATDFAIILPDGSRFEEVYIYEYSDFDTDKYDCLKVSAHKRVATYFESIQLVYIGDDEARKRSFSVSAYAPENASGISGNGFLKIYYELRGDYITFTTATI